jgi:site-specific DNA-methyltransferase (adenine-specific)/adenine-specific DNA-methyltransferase
MMRRFEHEGHTILHGDVLKALATVDTDSVDLIFADPPYNIGKDFNGLRDLREEGEYLDWCRAWIDECLRVLSPRGTFYLMCSTQMMAHLDLYCRERLQVLSRIVWTYDSSGVQARKYFGSMWEPILHMVADPRDYVFNADDIKVEAKTGAKRNLIDYRKDPPQPYSNEKVPGNVWDFARVRWRMEEYEDHPSQKPEALLERVIRASSNPGDLVMDPFAGTFTTCAVAARLGRRSLGVEINESYVKVGLRRVGIPSDYPIDELAKVKARKTNNRSKRDRGAIVEVDQASFL